MEKKSPIMTRIHTTNSGMIHINADTAVICTYMYNCIYAMFGCFMNLSAYLVLFVSLFSMLGALRFANSLVCCFR